MPTTTRWGLPYPIGGDSPAGMDQIQDLAEALAGDALGGVAFDGQGITADMPTAASAGQGFLFKNTTTGILWRSTGAAWEQIVLGTDTRLSDTRTPTDATVTLAKLAAAIKPSGVAAAGDEAVRALGVGANNAAAGNDARLTNTRTPSTNSLLASMIGNQALAPWIVFGGSGTVLNLGNQYYGTPAVIPSAGRYIVVNIVPFNPHVGDSDIFSGYRVNGGAFTDLAVGYVKVGQIVSIVGAQVNVLFNAGDSIDIYSRSTSSGAGRVNGNHVCFGFKVGS